MLRSIPLFKDLNEPDLAIISDLANDKQVTKGNVVLTEGEVGDSLYTIVSGRVKVFIGDEDGREIILKILGPGDFFGEMSLIDSQPRSASVSTLENSVFKVLSRQAFENAVERAPRIATLVMQALAKRLRDADRKISTLALMDVYGRVANTLLELAKIRLIQLVPPLCLGEAFAPAIVIWHFVDRGKREFETDHAIGQPKHRLHEASAVIGEMEIGPRQLFEPWLA